MIIGNFELLWLFNFDISMPIVPCLNYSTNSHTVFPATTPEIVSGV